MTNLEFLAEVDKLPLSKNGSNGKCQFKRNLALGLAISSTHSAEGADDGELPLMLKILQQRQQEWQLNKAMECHSKRWSGPLVSVCGTRTGTANATTVNKADEKGRVGGADADKIDCHGDSWFTEAPAKERQKLHFNC